MQKPETGTNENIITEELHKTLEEDPLGMQILIRGQEDELLNDITESLKEQVAAEIAPKGK